MTSKLRHYSLHKLRSLKRYLRREPRAGRAGFRASVPYSDFMLRVIDAELQRRIDEAQGYIGADPYASSLLLLSLRRDLVTLLEE